MIDVLLFRFILGGAYLLLVIPCVLVHIRVLSHFPYFKDSSIILLMSFMLVCLGRSSYFLLTSFVNPNFCVSLSAMNVLLIAPNFFIIATYVLHLWFWGRLYERSSMDTDLFPQSPMRNLRWIFVVYLTVIGTVVTISLFYLVDTFKTKIGCNLTALTTIPKNFPFLAIYVTIYLSLVFITFVFLLYKYVFNPASSSAENRAVRLKVGALAFLSLFCFVIRAIFDLLEEEKLKLNAFGQMLYYLVLEFVPLLSVLLMFLTFRRALVEYQPVPNKE